MKYLLRTAQIDDIDILNNIEITCFEESRISKRSFHHFITKAHANIFVITIDQTICGYGLILYKKGVSTARLYSLAVLPEYRKMGFGKILLAYAEQLAKKHHCTGITLEVRNDNSIAIHTYLSIGYTQLAIIKDYYEDHASALKMIKPL